MDTMPDPRPAPAHEAAQALARAAARLEDGRDPFARTRFRVVAAGKTPQGARHGRLREDGP